MGRATPGHDYDSTTQLELLQAVDACANAEQAQAVNKREYYIKVMDAYHAHHADVPKEQVSAEARREVEARMWQKWGEAYGQPRSAFVVPPAWWRRVAAERGYTDRKYAGQDGLDAMPEPPDSGGEGDTGSASYKAKERSPHAVENEALLRACDDLIDTLETGKALLRRHAAATVVPPELCETFTTESAALCQNVRELVNERVTVPTQLQSLLLTYMFACASTDAMFREFAMGVKEIQWGERREAGRPIMSHKEISNIVRSRVAHVPRALEPVTGVAAQMRGFHGAACPSCGSRRCLPDTSSMSSGTLRCLHCYHLKDGSTFAAPEHRACPRCHAPLTDDADPETCGHCGQAMAVPHALRVG